MPLTPKNRKEEWLQGLVDHETTLTPKNRPEEWMKEIIDASSGGGGTGGGVLKINVNEQGQMDKTWAEINEAAFPVVVASFSEGENLWMPVVETVDGSIYMVILARPQINDGLITFQETKFIATSETDYPEAAS